MDRKWSAVDTTSVKYSSHKNGCHQSTGKRFASNFKKNRVTKKYKYSLEFSSQELIENGFVYVQTLINLLHKLFTF